MSKVGRNVFIVEGLTSLVSEPAPLMLSIASRRPRRVRCGRIVSRLV
jgi:hypothetical protein